VLSGAVRSGSASLRVRCTTFNPLVDGAIPTGDSDYIGIVFLSPSPRRGSVRQLLVCFLRLAAAPRISATARPGDAFYARPHAENHFRICENLTNQKARVIGRE